jgi:hypothetical protein
VIDAIFGLAVLAVIGLIFFVASLAKAGERARARRRELEEWEGILDVRRETRDKLDNDPEYVKRVRDHFND